VEIGELTQGDCSISSLISGCLASRLDRTISAAQNLILQLGGSSIQVLPDTLFVNVLPTCSYDGGPRAVTLLCTIALLKLPVTPTLIAAIVQLPLKEVTALLQTLVDAQLVTPESQEDPVTEAQTFRLYDESLLKFFVDPFRNLSRHNIVEPAKNHRDLLEHCLRLLNDHLRDDICNIRNPGLANADVPDLPVRIARSVPAAVRYACVSWPVHLLGSGSASATVSATLLEFCTAHVLHWLEVLSLLGELSSAGKYLPKIIAWCQVSLLYVT
jgi:hypothetical protein